MITQSSVILVFKSEQYMMKSLSEKVVSIDFVDPKRAQSYFDFANYTKPLINYKPDDFLVLFDESAYKELIAMKSIGLERAAQFGWYYEKRHKVNIQIFSATDSTKMQNLLELNPALIVDSFDKLRNDLNISKKINMLAGALSLCYYVYKEDYDSLFKKFVINKNVWAIDLNSLEPRNDYAIITQLAVLTNSNDDVFINKFYSNQPQFILLYKFYKHSLNYLFHNTYSMSGYLEYLSKELSTNKNYSHLSDSLQVLNSEYVKKGISNTPKDKFVGSIKEFLEISKTESAKLKPFLDSEGGISKTALFLLGTLHLFDLLEEQFQFDNFIPLYVELFLKDIVEIKLQDNKIIIEFSEDVFKKDRNKKYTYITEYFREIRREENLLKEISELKDRNSVKETEKLEIEDNLNKMDREIGNLKDELDDKIKFCSELLKEKEEVISKKDHVEKENEKLNKKIQELLAEREVTEKKLDDLLAENEKIHSVEDNVQEPLRCDIDSENKSSSKSKGTKTRRRKKTGLSSKESILNFDIENEDKAVEGNVSTNENDNETVQ